MMALHRPFPARPGIAAIWTLVVIAVVSAAAMTATVQFANIRKQVDLDRNRAQALWLARSGFELAADRLMANPDGYTGETVSPIPAAEIKIVVRKDTKREGVYQIESEGRLLGGMKIVKQTDRRSLKLQKTDKGFKVEVVANEP